MANEITTNQDSSQKSPQESSNQKEEQNPVSNENNAPEKELEILKERLNTEYPIIFKKIESMYLETWDTSYANKPINEVNKILSIIIKHEHYAHYYSYKIDSVTYNFSNIYSEYYSEINSNKECFINDLIYMFRIGYVDLFVPNKDKKYFHKSDMWYGQYNNPYPFIENLCKLYNNIENGKCKNNAILFLTSEGDKYRRENLLENLLQEALNKQKELQDEQNELKRQINSYNKEIISIIAIILALAPLIAVNVSAIKDFTSSNLLVMNACLIIGISAIFSVVLIAFFDLKKKHLWLIAPIAIGILLLLLGVKPH